MTLAHLLKFIKKTRLIYKLVQYFYFNLMAIVVRTCNSTFYHSAVNNFVIDAQLNIDRTREERKKERLAKIESQRNGKDERGK